MSGPTLPEGWTPRHTRVARFALMRLHASALDAWALSNTKQHGSAEAAAQFKRDADDAKEALKLLDSLPK